MFKIGIIGEEDLDEASEMLGIFLGDIETDDNLSVECLYEEEEASGIYNILIIDSPLTLVSNYFSHIDKNSILVINSDHKEITGFLNDVSCPILSYGLNSKACVTASSVIENHYNTVLCCIQRCLPTFSGRTILQQEFSVDVPEKSNIYWVLATVTVALIKDVPIEKISNIIKL